MIGGAAAGVGWLRAAGRPRSQWVLDGCGPGMGLKKHRSPAAGEFLFEARGELGLPRLLVDLSFASELGDVQAMAAQVFDPLRQLIEGLELLSEGPVTLSGGVDAYEYTLGFPSDTLPIRGKLLVVPRETAGTHSQFHHKTRRKQPIQSGNHARFRRYDQPDQS